jgi:hypothetical protein
VEFDKHPFTVVGVSQAQCGPRRKNAEPKTQRLESRRSGDRSLETDLQDLAVVAYEPAGVSIGESDGPIAADSREFVPSLAEIGRPGSVTGTVIRLGFGGDYDSPVIRIGRVAVTILALRLSTDQREAEDGALDRWRWCELDRSPPATMPFSGSAKATEIAPALGLLTRGVS